MSAKLVHFNQNDRKLGGAPPKFPSFDLKGQCHEIFASDFFHDSSSPKPLKITLGSFQIFLKIRRYTVFTSQGAPPVSTTSVANFATSSAGIVDTGGKFATGVNDIGANLPLVYRVNDPGGKFATVVNNNGGKQWEQYQTITT